MEHGTTKKRSKVLSKDVMSPTIPEPIPVTLHLDMEDIEGLGDVEVGDHVTLSVKAEVVGIYKHKPMSGEETHGIDFRITSTTLSDKDLRRGKEDHEPLATNGR